MIAPNVIIVWGGTNASIPTGYSRVTTLDGLYPKGAAAATEANTTGGSSTHTHTSTGHTHTLASHTHAYTLDNTDVIQQGSASGGNAAALDGQHSHTGTSGTSSGAAATDSVGVTYASYANDPPYYNVIFVKPAGYSLIPDDGIILWNSTAAAPTGFAHCNGAGGTPDLRQKYLRGAGTGANAGTTGGSSTNTHTIVHSHTGAAHTHAAANSANNADGGGSDSTGPNNDLIARTHLHSISMGNGTQNVTDYDGDVGAQAETIEPVYTKLNPVQNTSGNSLTAQSGMVAMWLGSLATIPSGWVLCDGNNGTTDMRSQYLKCSNDLSEKGNTGGSNTHTHANQAHSHTGNGTHTHTAAGTGHVPGANHDGGGAQPYLYTVVHGQTVTAGTANLASANTSADSSSNEPEYRTVAYIQFKYAAMAGLLQLLV